MATRRDADRGGGDQDPNYGAAESPSAGTPIAREGTPKFFPMVPPPARGVMFRRCCVCKADLGSVEVEAKDPANGVVSHGYCDPCHAAAMKEAEALAPTDVHFTDHTEDAHAIAHSMGERFLSEDCIAFARAFGVEPLPGGVL